MKRAEWAELDWGTHILHISLILPLYNRDIIDPVIGVVYECGICISDILYVGLSNRDRNGDGSFGIVEPS